MTRRIVFDTGPKIIPAGDEGECRSGAPKEDFRWPLTKASDWCAGHMAADPLPPGCPPLIKTGDLQMQLQAFPEAVPGAQSQPSSPEDDRRDAENRQPAAQPLTRRSTGNRSRRPASGTNSPESQPSASHDQTH